MGSPDRHVIMVFARAPVLGTVKSRLARQLDDDVVLHLYRCFILDLLDMLDRLRLPVIICHTPSDAGPMFNQWLTDRYEFMAQGGSHLGARMSGAFRAVFARGFRQAVIIGSDVPDLPELHIVTAFHDLQKAGAVIGPSADGGYYLIGFRAENFSPVIFDGISWGTSRVLDQTLTIAAKENIRISMLPRWTDIDDVGDLAAFRDRHKLNGSSVQRTLTYLDKIEFSHKFS